MKLILEKNSQLVITSMIYHNFTRTQKEFAMKKQNKNCQLKYCFEHQLFLICLSITIRTTLEK
jgi:hypothetical protein